MLAYKGTLVKKIVSVNLHGISHSQQTSHINYHKSKIQWSSSKYHTRLTMKQLRREHFIKSAI